MQEQLSSHNTRLLRLEKAFRRILEEEQNETLPPV
jgi:hypothetical protein